MAAINDLPYDYDPRALGAQCDRCSLNGSPIVPSKGSAAHADLCIVAEAPGVTEEALAEPLVGPSGRETDRALLAAGTRREDCFLTNICLCRPQDTSMEGHLSMVAAQNRKRKKAKKELILPAPIACYPRLMHELQGAKALLLMGKFARATFYPKERGESKLMSSRGFPSWAEVKPASTAAEIAALADGARGAADIGGKAIRCLATVHPAFALRMGRWLPVFTSDVDKAVRAAREQLRWTEPEMLFWPTPEQLENFLAELDASRQPIAYDTETRYGLDWSHPKALRLLGIGTAKRVVCVPFQSVEEHPEVQYTAAQLRRFGEILVRWFASKGVVCSHNGKFDRLVCEHAKVYLPGWRMGRREFDSVIGHHVAFSELPHSLEFLSAQYTDAPAHKAVDHSKWHEVGDRVYHTYNMRDVAITAIVAAAVACDRKLIEQKVVLEVDHKLSTFCRGMEETGIFVDMKAASDQADSLAGEMEVARRDIQKMLHGISQLDGGEKLKKELADDWEYNPGSTQQTSRLLYEHLGITPMPAEQGGYTESGTPSVDKAILFQLCDRGVPQVVEDLIQRIIDYKEAQKLRGTYCLPMLPGSDRRASGDIRITDDGFLHTVWNPHVVVSGRLSSSPNLMNIRESMRAILATLPGMAFAYCDKSQLEARITAWLAQEEKQIAAFLAGADIHKVNAVDLFELKSVDDVTAEERQFTKTFVYAAQYLAGIDTIVTMLRTFRDKRGKRPYRLFSRTEGEQCYERLWRSRAAIMAWHNAGRVLQQQVGFLADEIHGRRRYFMDGVTGDNIRQELANHRVQGCKPGFTRVHTREGLLPIADVADTGEVWTGTRWARYRKLFRGQWELAELHLSNGQVHHCDTRDQLLVVGSDDYVFRSFADLTPGDRVCLSLPSRSDAGDALLLDDVTAYWMGFAVGNGGTPQGDGHDYWLILTMGDRKGRYTKETKLEEFVSYAAAHGYEAKLLNREKNWVRVGVNSRELRAWWEGQLKYPWGKGSAVRTVPGAVWRASVSARTKFLLGLFDADGYVGSRANRAAVLNMVNNALVREAQVLLRSVGVSSLVRTYPAPTSTGEVYKLFACSTQMAALGYGTVSRAGVNLSDPPPRFLVARLLAGLAGRRVHPCDRTHVSRMRHNGTPCNVYTLTAIAARHEVNLGNVYATAEVVETRSAGVTADTYTLSVDDPGHRFDSEGVISKNTASADVNNATFRALEAFPFGYAGKGSGIVLQAHDALLLCGPENRIEEDGRKLAKIMASYLGDMPLPVDLKVGKNYRDLKKVKLTA